MKKKIKQFNYLVKSITNSRYAENENIHNELPYLDIWCKILYKIDNIEDFKFPIIIDIFWDYEKYTEKQNILIEKELWSDNIIEELEDYANQFIVNKNCKYIKKL